MELKTIQCPLWQTTVQISAFIPKEGVKEYMVMITPRLGIGDFIEQLAHVRLTADGLPGESYDAHVRPLLQRYFISDAANQEQLVWAIVPENDKNTVSVIQQPSLNGSKVCLWMWLRTDAEGPGYCHNGYQHYFTAGLSDVEGDAGQQTRTLVVRYKRMLNNWGGRWAEQCIRTWFFVRDIDVNYANVARRRKEEFIQLGLNERTHYVASTGIQGQCADPCRAVILDAYAVYGLQKEQIRFLYAREYLNPTYEYGVTFERGTVVEYGDRKHIFISGTASINNRGEIVCPGDLVGQTQRMLQNVEALLQEAGSSLSDMAQMIIYLRDVTDYMTVKILLERKFPDVPKVIVLAPVCRPGWLVEMECIAIRAGENPEFRNL